MKKIAALIVMAALFAGTVSAYDVSWGGWISQEGRMTTDGGKENGADLSDDAKKAKYEYGASELSYTVNVTGENFGYTGTLDGWFSGASHGGYAATNARVWSQFNEMFTLHAGYQMKNLSYAPGSSIEGGKIFDDQFGMGMGVYNYASDQWSNVNGVAGRQYTQPVTGLIAEVKVDALEAAVVFRAYNGQVNQENAMKNNMVFNVKYTADMFTGYAGLAMEGLSDVTNEDSEYANHGLWLAASLNVVEGLTSDVKFETNLAEDSENQVNVISLNLGYDLGVAAIATETVVSLMDKDTMGQSMGWTFGTRITPANVPVVGLSVDAEVRGSDKDDAKVATAFGLNVNKVIGNVNNQLAVVYDGDADNTLLEDPKTRMMINYKITMWF